MQEVVSTAEMPISYGTHQRLLGKEKKRFDKRVAELTHRLELFQQTCPHADTDYRPDPSGTKAFLPRCLSCGLEIDEDVEDVKN